MNSMKFGGILLALVLAGCGAAVKKGGDPMAALERRAAERWQLLIEGKPELAYEYLTPGYRASRSRDAYAQAFRPGALRWQSIEWRGAECPEADACEVRLILHYTVAMPSAGDAFSVRELTERWLNVGGQWYHLPER